jgi:dihydroxyacetone kinase-like predicted kinase
VSDSTPLLLSAEQFGDALQSGIHRVVIEQDYLNRINVFPVADGDTGTNLSLSLSASLQVLDDRGPGQRIDQLLVVVADTARRAERFPLSPRSPVRRRS